MIWHLGFRRALALTGLGVALACGPVGDVRAPQPLTQTSQTTPSAASANTTGVAGAAPFDSATPGASSSAVKPLERLPPIARSNRVLNRTPVEKGVLSLVRWVQEQHGELGALVLDVASGETIAENSPKRVMNPASNQKVFTAAIALRHLGANFRFHTGFYGKRQADAIPALVLRSNGDPSFGYAELLSLTQKLFESGVRRVGEVLIDQSAFDDKYVPPAFEQQPQEWAAFRAPVSAVAMERNAVTLHVAPAAAGKAARVWFEPPGFVETSGKVLTEPKTKQQKVQMTLRPRANFLSAELAGKIGENAQPFQWSRRVDDPLLYAGFVLKAQLSALGIKLEGKLGLGGEQETEELAGSDSKPLAELLPELGKNSDNFYAETLFKAVGAAAKGKPGTSAKGAEATLEWLKDIDALDENTRIANGSGLFDSNQVSPHALVQTLRRVYFEPDLRTPFISQLAMAGEGTLKERFLSFPGRVHAKTGTLKRVVALTGYVMPKDGTAPVAFSFIVQGIAGKHGEVRSRIDQIVEQMAQMLDAATSNAALSENSFAPRKRAHQRSN